MHTCPNGKRYVGITCTSVNRRWDCGRGYIKCPYFWNAIQKYGWDNITHEILYTDLQEDEAKDLEKKLIKEYNTNDRDFGYNLTEGGDGTCGFISPSVKKVYQFDKEFNFVNEFRSGKHAATFLNLKNGFHILECCKHIRISSGGYYWSFDKDVDALKEYITEKTKQIKENAHNTMLKYNPAQYREYTKGYKTGKAKKIMRFDLDGNYICTYTDYADARDNMGFKVATNIQSCCNGNRLTCGNSIWMYEEDYLKDNSLLFKLVETIKSKRSVA